MDHDEQSPDSSRLVRMSARSRRRQAPQKGRGRWAGSYLRQVAVTVALAALLGLIVGLLVGAPWTHDDTQVQGVILDVEASSITAVDSFTLRTNDGRSLVFELAPEAARDPTQGFVGSHLRSHAVLASQVVIIYREEDGDLLALRMEDK